MADPDKIPETQSDHEVSMESSMVTESQDFHLVDCDETQKETQTQDEPEENSKNDSENPKNDPENPPQDSVKPAAKDSCQMEADTICQEPSKTDTNAQSDKSDKEEILKVESETDKNEKKEETSETKLNVEKEKELLEDDDDDIDFVQSSQVESLSPLKKQISGLLSVTSQKRKADSTEEPSAKFPRTCSQEDALSSVRRKLDEDMEEIFKDDEDRPDDEVLSSMIIQETQESEDAQDEAKSPESLQQVEQELKETLSQHSFEDNEEEIFGKSEEKAEEKTEENKEEAFDSEKEAEPEIPKISDHVSTTSENSSKVKDTTEKKVEETLDATEPSVILDDTKEKSIIDLEASPKLKETNDETQGKKNPEIETSKNLESPAIANLTEEKSIKDMAEASSTPKSSESNSQSKDSRPEETNFVVPTGSNRSRLSIEVIYDRATAPEKKPRELVEIDEDGEKIILDSSQESCDKTIDKSADKILDSSYKTCASTDYKSLESGKESSSNDYKSGYSLTNGSTGSRLLDSGITTTRSEIFTTDSSSDKKIPASPSKKRDAPGKVETPEIVSISDSDESFAVEDRSKLKESLLGLNHDNSTKMVSIEKELNILVKLKCLVCIDETTKEHVEKIITGVHCESAIGDISTLRLRNDNSANLADISGNDKDTSPGSVTSNAHPYPLNSRLSLMSMASTSSSSSAGSLNAKLASIKFQLPRAPAKHTKKTVPDSTDKKTESEDALEQIKKEWKNVETLTCSILNFATQELNSSDHHNGSTLRVDNSLERIRSSTPEVNEDDQKIPQSATPKRGARKSRNVAVSAKSTRVKHLRSSDANGVKDSPVADVGKSTPSSSRKRKQSPDVASTPTRQVSIKDVPSDEIDDDELVGKQVFAKWSDNKYYPGMVTAKTKTKFRVNFYDGQSKLIIEDFIVQMPSTLTPGLSVYATSDENDYGSCGIILEVKKIRNNVVYIVETDESDKIEVDIKNIFLTNDQVQVLKEETKIDMKSPPSTPKHLGKVTLENVIDGKRRSKRILTPVTTTPKAKRTRGSTSEKMIDISKPSASGVSTSRVKFEDNHEATSDSNLSDTDDSPESLGVQEEIMGTPYEQTSKGQQSANKGKGRGKKKSESPETIANLGPIPSEDSDLFKGMSFILSCASLDSIERYLSRESSKETKDSNSDPGTENEEEWSRKPFVRERLTAQLIAGGGKVYETFESIPSDEYANTKHITNVPNITKKALLCLSVGIKSYNHQWVIRCCQQNKVVNPSEEELPAGWSLLKKSYVEMFQRRSSEPFRTLPVVVVIPVTSENKEFITFWKKICENAGGSVLLVENIDDDFIQGTVVLTNKHCPSWVIEKAAEWKIPLVSTMWVTECLVEGDLCNDDAHPIFKYNNAKRSLSHISHLKRR